MFSIIIPSFNNLDYLKICLSSIKKNSNFNHEIIVFVNEGIDGTINYLQEKNIKYLKSDKNLGVCTAVNKAAKNVSSDYIIYAHDDMYFCPKWDLVLKKEIDLIDHNKFYLSGTMIERETGHIQFDAGSDYKSFDENKLLSNLEKLKHPDYQGTHWAPHLIHRQIWNNINGFSEEFDPGPGSDPDLNMKLWLNGVRIFKGLGEFKVYHFGSISSRKQNNFNYKQGSMKFLNKWKITTSFFVKHYLRGGSFKKGVIISKSYNGPLSNPIKNLSFFLDLFICKIKLVISRLKIKKY